MEHYILTIILAGVVAFTIAAYVILDGFDLGIGILYGWIDNSEHHDMMMRSIIPVWDGNETWLVLGGAILYGGFPEAYSTLLPTLYLPVILMLAALIFRGVSFEFIHSAYKSKFLWTFFFSFGSTLAAFCQGVALGTFVQGYTYADGTIITNSDYVWLTPFSIVCGVAVVIGYALLGATWLIAKTEGDLQSMMYSLAKKFLLLVGFFMIIVALWTPHIDPAITNRWFSMPNMLLFLPMPILTATAFVLAWRYLTARRDFLPFYCSISIFLLAYIAFAISVWPNIIPHSVTIWDAATPLKAQRFILVGIAILLPTLIAYTLYCYYVFKGKVTHTELHY